MNNPKKTILYRSQVSGKERIFGPDVDPNTLTSYQGQNWVKIGFQQPIETIKCWIISEDEVLDSIRENRPFASYNTTEYFRRLTYIGQDHIEGYLGREDMDVNFHSTIHTTFTYFKDYASRKNVYITFDRIALYKLVSIFPENPLKFVLKHIANKNYKKNQAFMIMPFKNDSLNDLYNKKLKPFLKNELAIDIYRADDFSDNDIIVDTIYRYIEESEFVIADTTLENKNSFYELGYAAALRKEIITIQNKEAEQSLFFDRAHIRTILYDPNDLEKLFTDLMNTIEGIRARLK